MSKCSIVELYNTRFKLNKPIKNQDFVLNAVTLKVYLGAQSCIEGFEEVFQSIKYLSLEKFSEAKCNYSQLPFLEKIVELKVKTHQCEEDVSPILNKCTGLKSLLAQFHPSIFEKIKLRAPLNRLYLHSKQREIQLSKILQALAKVPSRKTYLLASDIIMLDVELEGLQTNVGTAPEARDGVKRNLDYYCQAVYFEYNIIEERNSAENGDCYRFIMDFYPRSRERNFLMKLKHKQSDATLLIEAFQPMLPMNEQAWNVKQKFKQARNLRLIKAFVKKPAAAGRSTIKAARNLLEEGRIQVRRLYQNDESRSFPVGRRFNLTY